MTFNYVWGKRLVFKGEDGEIQRNPENHLEPYTAQETSYEVDWWGSFNLSTFGIVFAGLLIVGALLCKATIGGRTLDYVIVICASIVALIIAGGLVNA